MQTINVQQKQDEASPTAATAAPVAFDISAHVAEMIKNPAKITTILVMIVRIVLLVLIAITGLCTIIAVSKVSYQSISGELEALYNSYSTNNYGTSYSYYRPSDYTPSLGINSTTAICCSLLLPGCLIAFVFHVIMLIVSILRSSNKVLVIVNTVFGAISALGFFSLAVSMAVAYNQPRLFANNISLTKSMGEAVAAFSFLTSFTTVGLIVVSWVNVVLGKAESDANRQ